MALRNVHLPVWLGAPGLPRPAIFATLFALAVLPRATLITVLPLQAHALLGDAQRVSVLYFAVSLVGVGASLSIPWIVRRIRRRWAFSLGGLMMVVAAALLSVGAMPTLVLGMLAQIFAVAALEITLNLYVMDHVPRGELGRFEPLRVFYAAGMFAFGPWWGVALQARVASWAPYAFAAGAGLLLLVVFWYLRLTESQVVRPMRRPPPPPLRYVRRFFAQPRLRLSWVLAVGRSGWWSMFFIYAPIYAVTSGLGEQVGGALVSLGSASLFLVPLWGWVARRYGMRRLLVGGYFLSGVATVAVAGAGLVATGIEAAWLGAAILLGAAFVTGAIDGAGNLPFLRAVHPHERPEMTTVFATYRDAAQLVPPGVFSVLLKLAELPAVFLFAGGAMAVLSRYSRFIPRRL